MTNYHHTIRRTAISIGLAILVLTNLAFLVVLGVTQRSSFTSQVVRDGSADVRFCKEDSLLPADIASKDLHEAIVGRFDASEDHERNKKVILDDAVGAMMEMLKDGEPVPIHGAEGIFIGGVGMDYRELLDCLCGVFP